MATPLKLKDANGNIQELTTTEENYIAYQVGLHLSTADSAEVGSLNRATTGDTVGTYSNTFFNQAVGTHPSTSITTGTTNTVIYQTNGTAAETDSDVFRPLMWVDSGSETGFKMMPDVDLNETVDRYLSIIFTQEFPGSYRLSTSAPSGDWTEQQTAFIDTRTDGASIAHKLWKRTGGTAPTAVRPMRLKNEASFAGVQEMSDAEIKFSFGQRAKTRIAASKIGSYQLRNSSQGAPTDTGTWVAKGTATDTRNTTANQAFTRDSTVNFQANYTTSYTTGYATNFTSISNVNYTSAYTRVFDQGYSIDYTGGFNQGYTSTFTGTFNQNYDTQYTTQYTGNFLRNTSVNYDRQFTGQFSTNYQGTVERAYNRTENNNYVGQQLYYFSTNYTRDFLRYQGLVNYLRDFNGQFGGNVSSDYIRVFTIQYTGEFISNFVGPAQPQSYTRNAPPTYYQGSGRGGGQTTYNAPDVPGTAYAGNYARVFVGNYQSNYTRSVGVVYDRVFTGTFELQIQPIYYGNNYLTAYVLGIDRNYNRLTNINYISPFPVNYTTQYEGQYTISYTTAYQGNYQNEFSQNYTTSYTTGYLSDYDGAVYTATYDRVFTGVYTTSYEGAFDTAYSTAYEGNYENIYDKAFDTSYITDYLGNFQGNFEGETIQSASATNETYTLYVRIS
jgi:hypothetical protein